VLLVADTVTLRLGKVHLIVRRLLNYERGIIEKRQISLVVLFTGTRALICINYRERSRDKRFFKNDDDDAGDGRDNFVNSGCSGRTNNRILNMCQIKSITLFSVLRNLHFYTPSFYLQEQTQKFLYTVANLDLSKAQKTTINFSGSGLEPERLSVRI
jgi:hypothetical protein